jgi:sulfur carrier protein
MHQPIEIRVNGSVVALPSGATVADLLGTLGLDPQLVAVELNRRIVHRPEFAETRLASDDAVEVVEFVGGG